MGTNSGLLLLGVLAWIVVGGVAIVAVNWDQLLGFFVTLAAVLVAWAIGEVVVRRSVRGLERGVR